MLLLIAFESRPRNDARARATHLLNLYVGEASREGALEKAL